MPFSFTGFGPWALLLMLVIGIVQHVLSSRKPKKHFL
jgi:F0F1-type ATP synthase assembly protein I